MHYKVKHGIIKKGNGIVAKAISKNKNFYTLATDGKLFWKLLFIEQNSKGDFYTIFLPGTIGLKYSRHRSGYSHNKVGNQYLTKFAPKVPLAKLKIPEQLKFMSVPLEHFTEKSSTVTTTGDQIKKKGALAVLDIRSFKNGVAINPFIVEPKNITALKRMLSMYEGGATPYPKQIFIFTETNPWIVLLIHDSA